MYYICMMYAYTCMYIGYIYVFGLKGTLKNSIVYHINIKKTKMCNC